MKPTTQQIHQLARFLNSTPGWRQYLDHQIHQLIHCSAGQIVNMIRELRENPDSGGPYSAELRELLDPIISYDLSGSYYIPEDEAEIKSDYISLTLYEGEPGAIEYQEIHGEIYEAEGKFDCETIDDALEALLEKGEFAATGSIPIWTSDSTEIPDAIKKEISDISTYYIVSRPFANALERDEDAHILVHFGDAIIWRREACGQSEAMDPYTSRVVLDCPPYRDRASLADLYGAIHRNAQIPIPLGQFGWEDYIITESHFMSDGECAGFKAFDSLTKTSKYFEVAHGDRGTFLKEALGSFRGPTTVPTKPQFLSSSAK